MKEKTPRKVVVDSLIARKRQPTNSRFILGPSGEREKTEGAEGRQRKETSRQRADHFGERVIREWQAVDGPLEVKITAKIWRGWKPRPGPTEIRKMKSI